MTKNKQRISPGGLILKDQLISINRVTKVVKGGKNLSFAALVVVGDEAGHVGFGTGKAKEVPNAIKKAVEAAKNNLIRVPLIDGTLPHEMIGEYGAGRVLLKPAAEGTGVIAGGAVRAVLQSLGVHNVRTKILGSNNTSQCHSRDVQRAASDEGPDRGCAASRQAGRRTCRNLINLRPSRSKIEVRQWQRKQKIERAERSRSSITGASIGYSKKQKEIVKALASRSSTRR